MAITNFTTANFLDYQGAIHAHPTNALLVSVWLYKTSSGYNASNTAVVHQGPAGTGVNDSSNSDWFASVLLETVSTTPRIRAVTRGTAGFALADSVSAGFPSDQWAHAFCSFQSSTLREASHSGANLGSNTTSQGHGDTPARFSIGIRPTTSPNAFDAGSAIAEVSLWNGAGFDSTERAALEDKLAAGENPLDIDAEVGQAWTGALVAYWPLETDADMLVDAHDGGFDLTEFGTGLATFGSHPTIDEPGGQTFTLTADPGSVAVTGTAATLVADRVVTAAAGSYAITGTDASLEFGYRIVAEAGAAQVTGTVVTLTADRTLSAEAGAVTATGTDADLVYSIRMAADAGSVAVTGTAIDVHLVRVGDPGAFTVTGTDAELVYGQVIEAESGAVSITGTDASLLADRLVEADAGSVVISGTDATLSTDPTISAEAGSVAITGTEASFELVVQGESGSVAITGTDAALTVDRLLSAEIGSVILTGSAAELVKAFALLAETEAYQVIGTAAALTAGRRAAASVGSYVITGTDAPLTYSEQAAVSSLSGTVTLSPSLAGSLTLAPSLSGIATLEPT